MASTEQFGFVFAVTYLLVFTALLGLIPLDLQGSELTPDTIIPVDPVLVSGFSESQTINKTDMTTLYLTSFQYTLGDFDFIALYDPGTPTTIHIVAKSYWLGYLWFGDVDPAILTRPDGSQVGGISTTQIDSDATDGTIRYVMQLYYSGNSAGSLVIYWNTTAYATSQLAWDAGELYLLHGWGIGDSATANIGMLLIGLLTFTLPNVPTAIQVLFGAPYWASIVYILWFIFKEMIPF